MPVWDAQEQCYIKQYFETFFNYSSIAGKFAKSRNAPIGFVVSVCTHVSARPPLNGFPWNSILAHFQLPENSDLFKTEQKYRTLDMNIRIRYIIAGDITQQ